MARKRNGPTVRRQYACPACGHWQCGKSHYQARPVGFRDVLCIGGRRPKGDKTTKVGFRVSQKGERARDALTGAERVCEGVVYVDQVRDGGEFLTQVKLMVGRLAEVLGLVLEAESKLRAELDAKKQQLARLERALAELASRPHAAAQHRKPKRAKARAGARRTASLYGTPVKVKAGPRREDGLDARPPRPPRPVRLADAFSTVFRPVAAAKAKAGDKQEDGL